MQTFGHNKRTAPKGAVLDPNGTPCRNPNSQAVPHIFIPKLTEVVRWDEWMWSELREGGYLHEYLRREKALSVRRQRAVSRKASRVKPKGDSEWECKAMVPAREFFRWREQDEHFWDDDSNLKSLKRDNPDLAPAIFV